MKRLAVLLMSLSLHAAAPQGIPRELARERAQRVSDLRYRLHFELTPHADLTHGHETLTFQLTDSKPLLLDFREGSIQKFSVNGAAASTLIENGHLWLHSLVQGSNKLDIDFTAPVAPAGKAITRYEDQDDGSEYIYTLFVPMDASMAFPCFDQPDLKGRFTLELTHPPGWTVISNVGPGQETEPISTYLFAFAAGPFQKVNPAPNVPNVYVRKSQVARAQDEVPQIQEITLAGTRYLAKYFAQPFPFPKYDMVLIPGFPFGGMEHAGATFLNEDSMLFRSAPTESDRFGRNITVLHELTHQWFGDFTTMRWFDDLWLKEGFAQYMAYHAMADLAPGADTWARFYQQIKPAAYGIDITLGTTPIYQDIPNLLDAKSAYGAIVYSKAPGLLRQLEFLIGPDKFRDGLRLYLAAHKYGNAEWSDLVRAFEQSSGISLAAWADAWIRHRGMPLVTISWSCIDSKLASLTLHQADVIGDGRFWPIATQVLLGYANGKPVTVRAQFNQPSFSVAEAEGNACPSYIFANDGDHAYGLFLLDARSREYVLANIGYETDLFRRTMLWGSLFDAMHFAELDPHDYVRAALGQLPSEKDELLVRSITARTLGALHDYLSEPVLTHDFEVLAYRRMMNAASQGERIIWFRSFVAAAQSSDSLGTLKNLLRGSEQVPGVSLRPLDRWRMITALLSNSDSDGVTLFEAEKHRDASGIGQKYAYIAVAARAGVSNKNFYMDDYLHNPARPEDWVQDSLPAFNQWNQSEITFPYLRPALDALPQIKQQRKIFFLMAWLNAFIGGQHSSEASHEVHAWLAGASVGQDLRLKVLQVGDDLDRTVKIRAKFTSLSR
jgi:aminopeptidase N